MVIGSTINSTINNAIGSINGGTNGGTQFMASYRDQVVLTDDYTLSSADADKLLIFDSARIQELNVTTDTKIRADKSVLVSYRNLPVDVVFGDNVMVIFEGEIFIGADRFYPYKGEKLEIVSRGNNTYEVYNARRKLDNAREVYPTMTLHLDGTNASGVTFDTGTEVATYTDNKAFTSPELQPVLNVNGAGTIVYDGSGFVFDNAYFLPAKRGQLQNVLTALKDFGIFVLGEYNNEPNAGGANILHGHNDAADRFIFQQRGGVYRAANYYFDPTAGTNAYHNRRQIMSFGYNAANKERRILHQFSHKAGMSSASTLHQNTGLISGLGSNPTAPATTVGIAIGADTAGALPLSGKIFHLGIIPYQPNNAENRALAHTIADWQFVWGAGQSNEFNKHSTVSPYFLNGKNAYIDARNAKSLRNVTYYGNAAVSGTSISRKNNDLLYPGTPNNSWVDDRVAGAFVDDFLLTNFKNNIKATYGLNKNLPIKISVTHGENELFGQQAGHINEADIIAATNYFIDSILSEFPNAKIYTNFITKRNNNTGASFNAIREAFRKIIALPRNLGRYIYGADYSNKKLRPADNTHYSTAAYAAISVDLERIITEDVAQPKMISASNVGNIITIVTSDPVSNYFTNANFRPVGNLITNAEDFDNVSWVKGAGLTVTANTKLDPLGASGSNRADTITKTGVTTASLSSAAFTGTAAVYNGSIYYQGGTSGNVTIGLSKDGGVTFEGIAQFSLSGDGSLTSTTGSTALSGTPVIEKLDITLGSEQWFRLSLAATLTASANYRLYIFPDVIGGANAGTGFIYGAQVTLGNLLRDFVVLGGAKAFLRFFRGATELSQTNIVGSGINTLVATMSLTPTPGDNIDCFAMWGNGADETQAHTIPVNEFGHCLQMGKVSFVAT